MGDKCSQVDRDRWEAERQAEIKLREAVDAEGGFLCPRCDSTKYFVHLGPQKSMDPPNRHVYLPREISHCTCASCGLKADDPRDFSSSRKKTRLLAFVFQRDRGQLGTGVHRMIACFVNLGVHVCFTIISSPVSGNFFEEVTSTLPCDRSCRHYQGGMDDFSEERRPNQYSVEQIVNAAMTFKK